MAWANGKGKNWARIVATVLFALSAVSFLTSLPQAGSAPLLVAVSGLTTLVGALAIYFLWRKDSSAWFQAQSAPRF
jgi:LPXTG-motif cell wall-anchored protein